jgi:DNA polymerase-1
MNIPVVTCQGFEADDVIGTLAKQAEAEGFEVFMITSDKDYGQLVSDNIYLYKPGRQGNEVELLKKEDILELWGIKRVDQVIDMLGLQGDAVDNIPGVKGIGPKTAQLLLEKYDSIEGIIENADLLPEKQRNQILEHREIALLSKKLAAIDINAPVKFDSTIYTVDPFNKEALLELFRELEFRGLAKKMLGVDSMMTEKANDENEVQQYDLFGNAIETEKKIISQAANAHLVSKTIENTPHKYHLVNNESKRQGLIKMLL